MNNQKQIAVVGAGYWGKNLVRNFYELGYLKTVCDLSTERRRECSQNYSGIHTEHDYRNVLNDPGIRGVVLATPAKTHFALARLALESGKDVFVEKPLCLDPGEGRKLCELAKQKDRMIMVGHLLHYHPAVKAIKEMVHAGRLGKIHYIHVNRLNLGIFRTEENVLWSFAPHDISVILSLTGSPPVRLMATGAGALTAGVPGTVNLQMEFEGAIYANIFVSWLHPFKEQRLVIAGERGMLVFNDVSRREKLLYYPEPVKWQGLKPNPGKQEPEVVPLDDIEPLRAECHAFIQAVQFRKQPVTSGEEGLRVLRVLAAAQQSLENNAFWVKPQEEQEFNYFAHPTAVIDEGCTIGAKTKIWHFSHVMPEAEIGEECNIGQNVVISPGVKLGKNVKIQNNVSVYTGVTCEDDVFLGPSVVFTNVKNPRSHVNRRGHYASTVIRKGASIGANATIVCGVEIGEYALVGAGAVVTKDVPGYAVVYGNPAAVRGWACQCGSLLSFTGNYARCDECKKAYEKLNDYTVHAI
jgi:UDP-2-acetamido-3-amino-2,3-dideoxy-glucuronate N-acetyltransferase